MKYFTKYLPVEGEIKEGEHFWHSDSGQKVWTNNDITNINHDHYQKVQLFLCSGDIQLGDTYYHDSYCPYPKGEIADTNSKVMNAHMMVSNEGANYKGDWSYKVIGPISPEAVWVKEGMEFDRDDLLAQGFGVNWDDSQPNLKFKVKCPTCNTFH